MNSLVELFYQLVTYAVGVAYVLVPVIILVFAWHVGKVVLAKLVDRSLDALIRKRRFEKMGSEISREDMLPILSVMHPREFELYVADMFKKFGYSVQVVGGYGRGDGGIDAIAKRDGKTVYVQCKKFIGKDIGVSAVRDFYGAIADSVHKAGAMGYFITTTRFTEGAIRFSRGKRLRLVNGDDLINLIFNRELKGNRVGLGGLELSEAMRQTAPACPVCKKQLAWRRGPHGAFVGCSGFPACRYAYSPPRDEDQS